MQTHGEDYIYFYEFDMSGVTLESSTDAQCASDFIVALHVDQEFNVIARPEINGKLIGTNVEFIYNGSWVHGMVSRETADKICIKRCFSGLISFVWMNRKDIPKKLRFAIKRREEMHKYTFAAAVGSDGDDDLRRNLTKYRFDNDTDFAIPLWDKVLYSNKPDAGIPIISPYFTLFVLSIF